MHDAGARFRGLPFQERQETVLYSYADCVVAGKGTKHGLDTAINFIRWDNEEQPECLDKAALYEPVMLYTQRCHRSPMACWHIPQHCF